MNRPAILIVEDEAIVAHDLQQTLTDHGYDAFAIASSAEEAVARAEARCPDLILMDIRIKGQKDGVSAARTLRERFRVPVIYLTAHADDATLERAKAAEPSGYLLKPIRPAELKSSIEIALHRHLADEQREREREREQQAAQGQRFASLATMASGMAHELNNPLAVIVANAELVALELQRRLNAEQAHASAIERAAQHRLGDMLAAQHELQSAAGHIARVVADIRAFSSPAKADRAEADVTAALRWAIAVATPRLRERARLVERLEPVPRVALAESRLRHVLLHLLSNAAEAITPGAPDQNEVRVSVARQEHGQVSISVQDSGCGLTGEALQHIFEPYFTTKPVDAGSGLGLWTCLGIVNAAGGTLSAHSEQGRGSRLTVVLPASDSGEHRAVQASAPPRAAAPASKRRILVIDDEPMLLRSMRRMLQEHEVVCAESAREGLDLVGAGERFDLIVSDLMMPGMNGIDFYEELVKTNPADARRMVFVTGGALGTKANAFLSSLPNTRIEKPFAVDDLRRTIRDLLEP